MPTPSSKALSRIDALSIELRFSTGWGRSRSVRGSGVVDIVDSKESASVGQKERRRLWREFEVYRDVGARNPGDGDDHEAAGERGCPR